MPVPDPDGIRRAARAFASNATTANEARSDGAALGRAIKAQLRASEIQGSPIRSDTVTAALHDLAASDDVFTAEVARGALSVVIAAPLEGDLA